MSSPLSKVGSLNKLDTIPLHTILPPSPDFLDSPKLTAMLEKQLGDISDFVNSEKGAERLALQYNFTTVFGELTKSMLNSNFTLLMLSGVGWLFHKGDPE